MPIPKERLEAIPWARYCVEYATLLEKGFVKKRYSFDELDYNGETNDDDDHAPKQPYRRIKNP